MVRVSTVQKALFLGAVVLVASRGVCLAGEPPVGEQAELAADRAPYLTLRTIRAPGAVESARVLSVVSPVSSSIKYFAKEGQKVKKGELLVELDGDKLQESLEKVKMHYEQIRASYEAARSSHQVAYQQAEINKEIAAHKLKMVELAKERFLGEGGEFELELRELAGRIDVAETRLNVVKRLQASQSRSVVELAELELKAAEAKHELQIVVARREFLSKYEKQYRESELELEVQLARGALVNAEQEMRAKRLQAEASLAAQQAGLRSAERNVEGAKRQLEQCRVVAPWDGIAMLAPTASRRTPPLRLAVGADVRARQPLIRLADPTQFQISATVRVIGEPRIRVGQKATIRVDAFVDREMRGHVTEIGEQAFFGGSPSNSTKTLPVIIKFDGPLPQLRVGMTAEVAIHVDEP